MGRHASAKRRATARTPFELPPSTTAYHLTGMSVFDQQAFFETDIQNGLGWFQVRVRMSGPFAWAEGASITNIGTCAVGPIDGFTAGNPAFHAIRDTNASGVPISGWSFATLFIL